MNKYQEAKDYYFKVYDENHLGMLARHYIDILQEAVEKAKKYDEKLAKPTEEEIKKEWEKLGYEWEKRENIILIYNRKTDKMISINTIICGYICDNSDGVGLWITFQEHQLLTKTFKWLGWEV